MYRMAYRINFDWKGCLKRILLIRETKEMTIIMIFHRRRRSAQLLEEEVCCLSQN